MPTLLREPRGIYGPIVVGDQTELHTANCDTCAHPFIGRSARAVLEAMADHSCYRSALGEPLPLPPSCARYGQHMFVNGVCVSCGLRDAEEG